MMDHFPYRQLLTVLLVGTTMTTAGSAQSRAIATMSLCLTEPCNHGTFGASSPASSILAQGVLRPQMDFFDIGQRKLEQEILRMQQQPPSPVVTVSPSGGSWQPIISKAGNFSIWMSPGTLSEETKELDTTVGKLQFKVLASNSGGDRTVVAYTDLPQSVMAQSPDTVLMAIQNRLKSRTSYTLNGEQSISLASYPGRSLTFSGSGEIITVRYYLANQRLYLIAAKHKGNAVSQSATTFLNSFQFLAQ